MFNLRTAYFYLLAVKIILIRFLKELYFTTNYYNKSLKTRTPEQLYFYPNPFLLSSFANQKIFGGNQILDTPAAAMQCLSGSYSDPWMKENIAEQGFSHGFLVQANDFAHSEWGVGSFENTNAYK